MNAETQTESANFLRYADPEALSGAPKKMAEPARTPPFLPERRYLRTKAVRTATASERPSIGPVARVASSQRALLNGIPASTRH